MKKLALLFVTVGMLAQLATVHAVGVGTCYEGNTEGSDAYENLPEPFKSVLLGLPITIGGGSGGPNLDLSGGYLPEYLIIKGGPRYVVLDYAAYSGILNNGILNVADTCLVNPGDNPPTISHWEGRGGRTVPEPSTALASFGVLIAGAFMSRRFKKS